MAHFSIISSQSGQEIFEGAPRYVGAYLKPGYLEFSEIGSPAAIDWHVGDYIVYSRTGKTYRLYRTPQTVEQGNAQRYGAAFLYENVQFFDDSKQLEFCPFTDLVPGDNTIHFSTQNTVSFFGKPLNVAERLQACLEAQYGSGSWAVRIVSTTDADLLELLDAEVEFSVSGANCQQVLDKVYELWNGLGWIHSVENGVNVITIGASNVRTSTNTTVPFAYDNGLVRVERSIANADRIGTRLYAYGSMKNMDATYYRGLNIKDAESVDIEHLMIPLASWGLTDALPDARKAYIENASAIASLGLIPRAAYFDGTGDLPDIFPTIERMTIGEVYDAGGAGYLPSLSKWARSQRIDEVVSASNPSDHGTSAEQGQKYAENFSSTLGAVSESFIDHDWLHATIYSATLAHGGKLTLRFGSNRQVFTLDSAWGPTFDLRLTITAGTKTQEIPLTVVRVSDTSYYTVLPETVTLTGTTAGALEVKVDGYIGQENDSTAQGGEGTFTSDPATTISGGVEYELDKTFSLIIPQIGFDIDNYADLGNGKTISMKTGMCAGRDFEIKDATYNSSSDSWQLTLYRSVDEDLNIMFPNADYQIAAGDQYVLLDIAMPELYVTVASQRLLEAAQRLLADISVEQPFYAPQIDAKVVYNEGRVLREGMWMDVTFDSAQEYVLIDSITIDENGSNIPTYEVALREKKGLDWTENVGSSSSSRSSSSVNGSDQQQAAGTVTSVGMTVPEGMEVLGSPINSAGILSLQLKQGYIIPRVEDLGAYFQQNATLSTLVELKSAYSYIGTRKGLVFDTEADPTNSPAHLMVINKGTAQNPVLALYSPLPLITGGDQIVIDGDPQGGGGGGGATMLRQLEDVYHNATSVLRKNGGSVANGDLLSFDSAGNRWVALDQSTITPDLSNYYTKTQTDTEISTAISALNLGAAATYGVGTVTSGNGGLVTGGSVYSAINEAVSSVLKMQGTTTTAISDGSTTNPIVIDGSSYTAKKGDVVMYSNKEFWWTGSAWEELGDEASWALKTTTISAGTGLTGGGTLASNRTISLSDSTIASLALADSAYQKPSTGIPQTDLASALSTKIDNGSTAYGYFSNGILPYNHGGTGISSYTKGNIIYASANNTLAKLAPNTGAKQFLTMTSSVPSWGSLAFSDLPNLYLGTTQIQSSSAAQSVTGVINLTMSGELKIGTAKIWWDSEKNALRIDQPLITEGDQIVIDGTPGGGGASGVDLATMWASLTNSISDTYANTKIAAAHIPDMSSTYGYLKAGDVSGVYLPLNVGAGKTITSTSNAPLEINSTTTSTNEVGFRYQLRGENKAFFGYNANASYGAYMYNYNGPHRLGITDAGVAHFDGNALLHAGNYTSYVNTTNFPGLNKVGTVTSVATGTGLSGGTITTSGTISLATSGVTAGTYYKTTVDTYGRVTSGYYADLSAAINGDLGIGTSNPTDTDYYIAQYAGGGTSTTSYHRRPHSALYNYINDKLTSAHAGLDKVGTVTSVAMTVPTGLSISGTPITTSGTIAISFTSGYSIPTTAKQSNWDTAYGWGNHASAGYLLASTASSTYVPKYISRHHGATADSYTGPTYLSTYVGNNAIIERGSWAYANNGYIDTGVGIIGLAGTMVIASNYGTNGSAIFVTPSTSSTGGGAGANNEMFFFTQNGNNTNYPDAWTRVMTNRNFTYIIGSTTYAPYNANGYLPLTGGTMTGAIQVGEYTAFGVSGSTFYLGSPAYPVNLRSNGTTQINGNTIWHSGNDGSGSGLDADTLDGLHGDAFVRWYKSTSTDFTAYFPTAQIVTKYNSTDGLSGDGAVITIPTWNDNNANNYYNVQFVFGLEPTTFTIRSIHNGSVNYTNTVYTTANANRSTVPWAASSLSLAGGISGAANLEFNGVSSSAGHGGFIDFHYNGSTADYTSRIIENASGILAISGQLAVGGAMSCASLTASGNIYTSGYVSVGTGGANSYVGSDAATNIFLHNSSGYILVVDGVTVRRGATASTATLGSTTYPWAGITATSADFRLTNFMDFHIYRNNSGGSAGITYFSSAQTSSYWNVGMDPTGTTYGGRFYWYYTGSYLAYLTTTGIFVSTGDQVVSSDRTLKTNFKDVTYSVADIANAPAVTFDWKDGRGRSAGSIAQYWKDILPELVHGEEGNMSLAYGQLALVNTILLARQSESHEERIARLEARVAELEMENERLRMN